MSVSAAKRRTPSLGTIPSMSTITIDLPVATPSITNKPASTSASLYHTCRSVLDRLDAVPGLPFYLDLDNHPPIITSPTLSEPATPSLGAGDPVTRLWQICRHGTSLCLLYNTLRPEKPLKVSKDTHLNTVNSCKAMVYHFIVACRNDLQIPEDDLFTITDLYHNDTNGFVKVLKTVNLVLDMLEAEGIIQVHSSQRNSDPDAPKDTRDRVVLELLETERKYVQDMEILQTYMRELSNQKILPADTIHYLFANLNSLVDFQRRFLIAIESNADMSPQEQRFGRLFIEMEESFSVYEPFCANYHSAQDLALQLTPTLQQLKDLVDPTYELPSLLIKPVQRICKYPLLLNELTKSTPKDWPHYAEMAEGLETMRRVTERVNETQRKQENMQAVQDLKKRVEDWKGYDVDHFGSLLLQEKFLMSSNDAERELHVFLFEKILLICKEIKDTSKRLGKNASIKKKKRGSLQMKGKIFITSLLQVVNASKNGVWSLKVFWRDHEVESFSLRCQNEEQLKQWETTLNRLLSEAANPTSNGNGEPAASTKRNVSNTHLTSLANLEVTPRFERDDDASSFIDEDEDEDEEDGEEMEETEEWQNNGKTRSANPRPGRPRGRTQDGGELPRIPTSGRSHMSNLSGVSLPPLPRSASSSTTTNTTTPTDYSCYPASPPPSNPSSPTTSARGSTGSTASIWKRRSGEDASPLADTVAKFMMSPEGNTPTDDYRHQYPNGPSPRMTRAHSHSVDPNSGASFTNGHPMPLSVNSTLIAQRLRSQSSPNVHNRPSTSGVTTPTAASTPGLAGLARMTDSPLTTEKPLTPNSPGSIKLKLNFNDGIYVVVVPQEIEYAELVEKVEKKVRLCGNLKADTVLRIKYQDEDGDYITINSDDDIQMAFEGRGGGSTVNLFVS